MSGTGDKAEICVLNSFEFFMFASFAPESCCEVSGAAVSRYCGGFRILREGYKGVG
jgi:hypothetical protein